LSLQNIPRKMRIIFGRMTPRFAMCGDPDAGRASGILRRHLQRRAL
jgi:hypothetical protein